jgi:hypothetical protein
VILELAIIGVVAGVMLGRYKVMILVPTIISSVILAVIAGVVLAYSLCLIILMIVVLVGAVQAGYVGGIAICAAAEHFQAERKRLADLSELERDQAEREAV